MVSRYTHAAAAHRHNYTNEVGGEKAWPKGMVIFIVAAMFHTWHRATVRFIYRLRGGTSA